MENAGKIADLKPGKEFSGTLFSRSNIEQKKGNGPDIKLTLAHNFRRYSAKKWNVTTAEQEIMQTSQFLVISGKVDVGQYEGEITITSVRAATEEEIPGDHSQFCKPLHENYCDHLKRFEQLIDSVQEPHLSLLLETVFDSEKSTRSDFCSAQAAGKKHHAYPGGLLHHSVEVAELCAAASEVIPDLSRDLLVACALLHDVGKIYEMEHGLNAGQYTPAGILNGHISLGANWLGRVMAQKKIPSPLKETVMHMVLSHHGTLEYGSPKPPMFAEAQVLAQCDMISARVYEYSEAAKNAKGQLSVWLSGKENIQVYTGDLGLQKVERPIKVQEPVAKYTINPQLASPDAHVFQTQRMRIRGLVAAGSPDQGNAEGEETREVVPPACGADFLVRVTGDSMDDEGLREGDLLFVKEIETPKSGDIVIAHLGESGEVVKRFRIETMPEIGHEKKWLESENKEKAYPNIPIDSQTRIRGKVVGLIRDF